MRRYSCGSVTLPTDRAVTCQLFATAASIMAWSIENPWDKSSIVLVPVPFTVESCKMQHCHFVYWWLDINNITTQKVALEGWHKTYIDKRCHLSWLRKFKVQLRCRAPKEFSTKLIFILVASPVLGTYGQIKDGQRQKHPFMSGGKKNHRNIETISVIRW